MRQHAPLSAFYFGYYAALGAFTPYFARWIVESGHGAWLASVCLSLWYATRIVAPAAPSTGAMLDGCALAHAAMPPRPLKRRRPTARRW